MKSVKLLSIFIALILISSCSLQDERLIQEDLQLNSGDLTNATEISQAIQGRYIVVFRDLVTNPSTDAEMLRGKFGLQLGHIYENVFKGFSASIPDQALNGLRNHPLIDFIEPDITMYASEQIIPTGVRRIAADKSATADIDGVDEGMNVDAAVIDTGIDQQHPELNVVGGVRFYLGMLTDSKYDDDHGHGSHVAGIIAARDNGSGVVGVAPGARLYAVKVLNSRGSGYLSDIIKGLDWVRAKASDIEVINMSLGGQGSSTAYRTAIQNCVAAGIVVVVAAGNESMDVFGPDGKFGTSDDLIPASYPEAATISAMADSDGQPGGTGPTTSYGSDDSFASFSNFSRSVAPGNPVSSPGLAIDLILPGVNIYSCYKDMNYATMSGTSMASPHAAGLAALYIVEHGRAYTANDVYAIRQALINAGKAQNSAEGLSTQNDPDQNPENLGWAGSGTPQENQPPVADFIYSATDLSVTFTDKSTDDGTIVTRGWTFGDGTNSALTNPTHVYATSGTYSVSLTVTDNGNLSASVSHPVTVNAPEPGSIVLTATPTSIRNRMRVSLTWIPSTTVVDVYRNNVRIATSVSNSYTDNLNKKGVYVYEVRSGNIRSNAVTITY
jgi:subtilisin family serine protease